MPPSRVASLDQTSDEERIHSLPVIELPDGLFDTVRRKKAASNDSGNSNEERKDSSSSALRKKRSSIQFDGLTLPNKVTMPDGSSSSTSTLKAARRRTDDVTTTTATLRSATSKLNTKKMSSDDDDQLDRRIRLAVDDVDSVVRRKGKKER